MDIATRPDLLSLLATPDTLKNAGAPKNAEEARAAAQEFEAFFLRTVLEDIIPEPKQDALGGGGHAEQLWGSLLHEHYAEILAERGGVGIADLVYQQLISLQETQKETPQETQKAAQQQVSQKAQGILQEKQNLAREDNHDDNF